MGQKPKKEKQDKPTNKAPKKQQVAPKKEKKKKEEKQLTSLSEIVEEVSKVEVEKPKAFEELIILFDAFRKLKDISNQQIADFLQKIEEKAASLWVPMLAKMTTLLCQDKHDSDVKIIHTIHTICKEQLEKYGIYESALTSAERNVCLQVNGRFVAEFLKDAYKQSQKSEQQISNADLACLSFVCFTLYCKTSYDGDPKIQRAIDRAIAEFFSSYEISGIREKDLAGKTIGNIMSAKVFSPKRISELTYLYTGTTELIAEQTDTIRSLEEIKRSQIERINFLSGEVKSAKAHSQELQDTIDTLNTQTVQLAQERDAAESMLEYEKNKFVKLLQSQKSGLADQLTADIALELQALRELVEYLESDDQKRFRRRLDRIDGYLQEFGGNK